MLRGLSLALAEEGHMVSVVARTPSRLKSLTDEAKDFSGAINPLPLDYRDGTRLLKALRQAVERFGPFGLAVCWIHSTRFEALRQVAGFIADTSESCRLFPRPGQCGRPIRSPGPGGRPGGRRRIQTFRIA